jgi:hypothetical protein
MVCPRCQTVNPGGSVHCYNCGHDLSKPAERRQPRPAPTPPPPQRPPILFHVDIAGTMLKVTDREITFGEQRLFTPAVTGISYGVFKQYSNGVLTGRSYGIWLTDSKTRMHIECANSDPDAKVEQRYTDALNALYPAVIVPIMTQFLEWLEAESGFMVGDVTFNRAGMHRDASLSSSDKASYKLARALGSRKTVDDHERALRSLPWREFAGYSFHEGSIRLHRGKSDIWTQFPMRDTWNAVCLPPLLDFLFEDGKLWRIAE